MTVDELAELIDKAPKFHRITWATYDLQALVAEWREYKRVATMLDEFVLSIKECKEKQI